MEIVEMFIVAAYTVHPEIQFSG